MNVRYVQYGRTRIYVPASGLALWSLWRILRWLFRLVNTTVQVWWAGTGEIFGWLQDKGELSRADGLRVLAACAYVFASWFAGILVIVTVMTRVLL